MMLVWWHPFQVGARMYYTLNADYRAGRARA
jgi:hypothetical protein